MINKFHGTLSALKDSPKKWLVTGVAGFIGSNLLEVLLQCGQLVVGLDSFVTGHQHNLDEVRASTGDNWNNFVFIEGDICNLHTCEAACNGVDYVLHQAALGSVPRSINDPISTNRTNVDGFLNIIVAARNAKVTSFVYAASSSTYGDHTDLPKIEETIGKPMSPYAVTKYVNELYADVFAKAYGLRTIGLRYFNVFGKRQDPKGSYAAVIPKWISAMLNSQKIVINGDGQTSRDFCHVRNVVQANLLAACAAGDAFGEVYNVAAGARTSLNSLFQLLRNELKVNQVAYSLEPDYQDFRLGDVRHSQANIDKAKRCLGYVPCYTVEEGIRLTVPWYLGLAK